MSKVRDADLPIGEGTLFDYYVGQALGGLLANPTTGKDQYRMIDAGLTAAGAVEAVAESAVQYALAALKARGRAVVELMKNEGGTRAQDQQVPAPGPVQPGDVPADGPEAGGECR